MGSPLTREEIVRQMTAIRMNLDGEVGGIVRNAQKLVDWRYYVRNHPWASILAAVGVGYLAVPAKSASPIAVLPATGNPMPQATPQVAAKQAAVAGGMFGSLASLATNYALRTAAQYAMSQFTNHWSAAQKSSTAREEVRS